jgi:tetratricopeptide (TPR) repeat protein
MFQGCARHGRGQAVNNARASFHLRRACDSLERIERRIATRGARKMWDGPRVRRDLEGAEDDIELASRIEPAAVLDEPDTAWTAASLRARALHLRGEEALARGARTDARRHLLQALRYADLPVAHFLLGAILLAEAETAQAAEHFEASLQPEPWHSPAGPTH